MDKLEDGSVEKDRRIHGGGPRIVPHDLTTQLLDKKILKKLQRFYDEGGCESNITRPILKGLEPLLINDHNRSQL
tara:strand:- start:40436 stop:40660 length:225 start_codon:yes stop_codon:yes gene_type:complete